MHTQEIHVAKAREAVSRVRECLLAFREVLDVLATSRPESLVVVVEGRPRPAEWSAQLRAAGLDVLRPAFRVPPGASDKPSRAARLARAPERGGRVRSTAHARGEWWSPAA
jgi:hypothetical protein